MDKIDERAKMIDKINKIKRKADGTNNLEERDAFLGKMVKLMNENGLTEADLLAQLTTKKIGYVEFNLQYTDAWRSGLIRACAKLCGCFGVGIRDHHGKLVPTMKIFGRDENTFATIELYSYVLEQIKSLARMAYGSDTTKRRNAQKGLAVGTIEKILDLLEQNLASHVGSAVDTKVPMVIEADMVQRQVLEEQNNIRFRARAAPKVTPEFIHGQMLSEHVNIRREVG